MPIGNRGYHQQCTYWGSPTQGGFGETIWASPIILSCKWEDTTEQFTALSGEEKTSRSKVWTTEKLDIGGYLAKGDQTATPDPTVLNEAFEIERSDEVPDLRGLNYERISYL